MKPRLRIRKFSPASVASIVVLSGVIGVSALPLAAEEAVVSTSSAAEPSAPDGAAPATGTTPPSASDTVAEPSEGTAPNTTGTTAASPSAVADKTPASEGTTTDSTTAESAVGGGLDSSTESTTEPSAADPKTYPKHAFILTYDMAVPVGDTWRYIGAFSPSGCSFDYRYHFTPRLAVGALIGWNSFEIKEKGTFVYDLVTVTGTQIRSMDAMYFGADFHLNILPITAKLVPYIGIDLVAYHLWRATDFGWWSAAQSDWHFGFAPSVGVLFKLPGVTLILGSKFQMAVKTSDAPTETYVSFNLGVGLD